MYSRPTLWGNANEIETSLWCFHLVLAMILKRESEFRHKHSQRLHEVHTSVSFAHTYRSRHPDAIDADVKTFVLENWKLISAVFGSDLHESP